jgi:Domain of unknown function (DUF1707)
VPGNARDHLARHVQTVLLTDCQPPYSKGMMGGMSPVEPGEGAVRRAGPARAESRDEPAPRTELRASHQDRDRVVEVLRMAAGDGRITADELDERLEAALKARTFGELAVLTTDLPAPGGQPAADAQPKDVARIESGSSHVRRDGPWLVPRRMQVRVRSGSVKLDFTEAVITQQSLAIEANVSSGSLTLVTKPGIVVDADDVTVRSGRVTVKAPWGTDVPVRLRISVSGKVGSGGIKARPRRRSFWGWLLRRPRPYQVASR